MGLSELALTDLKNEVEAFEEAIEAGHVGRRDHVDASADLNVVTGEVLNLVGMLDGLHRYRFRNDAELMAELDSVSHVRPFRPEGGGASRWREAVKFRRPREGPATGVFSRVSGAVGLQVTGGLRKRAPGQAFTITALKG